MTATYTKPAKTPRWADTSTNILEPPEAKKDEGWLFEEIPPSSFENWRTNLIGVWAKWIDERLFDGSSADEFLIKSPGDATDALLITDTYVKAMKDLRVESDDLGIEVDGTSSRRVYFDAAKQNWLGYSIGGSRMELYAGGVLAIYADATGTYINGDLNIGDDLSLPGGLAVGIATPTIADDVIQLGDADSRWEFNSGNPRFVFDHFGGSVDALGFDRTNSRLAWYHANVEKARFGQYGLSVADGIYVGDVAGTPLTGKIQVGDSQFVVDGGTLTTPRIQFDANDSILFTRASNQMDFKVNVASRFSVVEAGAVAPYGLRVGFTGNPTDDRIELGDSTSYWNYAATLIDLNFDTGDQFSYDRTNNRFVWNIATTEEMRLTASGLAVGNGLYVGDVAGTPVDNAIIADGAGGFGTALRVGFAGTSILDDLIEIGDSNFYLRLQSGNPTFVFDSNDGMSWDRSTNTLTVTVNVAPKFYFNASGLSVANGIHVGSLTSAVDDTITSELHGVFWGGLRVGFSGVPTNDRIELGDPNMFFQFASDVCEIDFAAGASFSFSRTNSRYAWLISTIEEMRLTANGLAVGNGIYVGDVTGTPTDNKVYAEGDLEAGVNAIVAGGLRVGFSGTPTADRIELGDADMYLQWASDYPSLRFAAGDYLDFDRANNVLRTFIGSTSSLRLHRYASFGLYPNGDITNLYLGDNTSQAENAGPGGMASRMVPYLEINPDSVDTANQSFQNCITMRVGPSFANGVGGEIWIGAPNNNTSFNSFGLMLGGIFGSNYDQFMGANVHDGVIATSGVHRGFAFGNYSSGPKARMVILSKDPTEVVRGGFFPTYAANGFYGYDLGSWSYPWNQANCLRTYFKYASGNGAWIGEEGTDRLCVVDVATGNRYLKFIRTTYTPNYSVECLNFYPDGHGAGVAGNIGDATSYWLQVYVNNLRYKSAAAFDTYDDLGLIEQCEPDMEREPIQKEKGGATRAVQPVKASTIPWPMLADFDKSKGDYFIDAGDASMFLLGAIKQLYKRYKSEIAELKARIAALESPA